jgi:hypothetical protein
MKSKTDARKKKQKGRKERGSEGSKERDGSTERKNR